MDIYEKRNDITQKYEKIIEDLQKGYIFNPYVFDGTSVKDEKYYINLEYFHYLFSLGEEAQIYLWNCMWPVIKYYYGKEGLHLEDFNKEELDFINEIIQTQSDFIKKYGEPIEDRKNANEDIISKRIKLTRYDLDLNKQYLNVFKQNHEEYENYYSSEYDDEKVRSICNQFYRQLSFAIILKDYNTFIGSIGLSNIRNDAVYNIEYYILPEYRNNGYAKEAIETIIKAVKENKLIIFEETIRDGAFNKVKANIKCIEAKIRDNNIPSINLIKKFGFKENGVIPYFEKLHGVYQNGLIFDYLID